MKITDVINFKDVNKSYHWNKHLLTKDESELKVVVLFTNAYGECYQPSAYWRDLYDCEPYKHLGIPPHHVLSHYNIFRTNSALLEKAIDLIDSGESIAVEVDIKSFIKKLEAAQYLYQGKTNEVKHDDIACFSSWLDLVEAAQEDADLKRIAKIVSEKKTNYYIEKFNEIVSKTKADVLLTTAHKSKGKEWSYVKVADDFMLKTKEGKQVLKDVPQAELNMMYVACTRATHSLEIPFDLFEFVYPKAKSAV